MVSYLVDECVVFVSFFFFGPAQEFCDFCFSANANVVFCLIKLLLKQCSYFRFLQGSPKSKEARQAKTRKVFFFFYIKRLFHGTDCKSAILTLNMLKHQSHQGNAGPKRSGKEWELEIMVDVKRLFLLKNSLVDSVVCLGALSWCEIIFPVYFFGCFSWCFAIDGSVNVKKTWSLSWCVILPIACCFWTQDTLVNYELISHKYFAL